MLKFQPIIMNNLKATVLDSWSCFYTVTIGRTNYRHLNNQPCLRIETSYEDEIWLIALTIACQIDQGIVLLQYPLAETKSVSTTKS